MAIELKVSGGFGKVVLRLGQRTCLQTLPGRLVIMSVGLIRATYQPKGILTHNNSSFILTLSEG
jgi:hypothetical protein